MIEQHIYHFFLKFILSERLDYSLWESDVFLISEFTDIVSILFYNFIEFIVILYNFLAISFVQYKKYIICLISFSKFSDVLPAFTCSSAIGNLWSIYLEVNILSRIAKSERGLFPYFALGLASDSKKE